ncbi:hypothetical protein [Acinetobacter baumannii]|uniref:hypothetical protein n=1 Tax=Acinetobacter baumannii TaxID=470 RepID=UPI00112A6BE6|nr:hypothetical protein [Acinetobacter baumannii]MDI9820496.1 hypothetical protein [Acinetobacter baumannii]TPT83219.1 hypothetical protein FJU52_13175 [Acinetobacter baumannii]
MYLNEDQPNNILQIILKNLGILVSDSITFGGASKIHDTYAEITEYTKKCNDALYYLQVDKFLNSLDIDQTEFDNFIKENPDNLKLGLETIKILEQTNLDRQAEMLARAFQLYIKNPISENKKSFHRNVHIIKKIDEHLISEIEDLKNYPVNPPAPRVKIGQSLDFTGYVNNPHKDLINFGFLKLPKVGINSAGREYYEVTEFFEFFFNNILKKPESKI